MKILCAADLHLGRRPARLPTPWNRGRITAASAWDDLVDHAVEAAVDAVLLAGDVVDRENRFFEAYGPLGRGADRLRAAGIPLLAVAGNHDHDTLHQVAVEVAEGHMEVLGRGGRWQRRTLRDASGRATLHVDGWSFPASRHAGDPLADYPDHLRAVGSGEEAPVLGLLHCDRDGTEAHYAPVSGSALAAQSVSAWVLGHIHVPGIREQPGTPPQLYCGSLLALDRGERGRHGAWLLDLDPDAGARVRPVALSRVRYDTVEIGLDGVDDGDRVKGAAITTLRSHLEQVVDEGCGPLEVVVCDVRVTGRTSVHGAVEDALAELPDLDALESEGVRLAVGRVHVETRPALDLEDLARGHDAPALLAGLLLDLDQAEGADSDLLDRATGAAGAILRRPYYLQLPEPKEGEAEVAVAALRRQATRLLDELMREKAGA